MGLTMSLYLIRQTESISQMHVLFQTLLRIAKETIGNDEKEGMELRPVSQQFSC